MCPTSVATVLSAFGTKNVALMREIAYLCNARDIASPAYLLTGLPMLGWTPGAEGLMQRVRPPSQSVDEFLRDREDRNQKVLTPAKPSGDAALDDEAMAKTMAEGEKVY